MTVYSVRQVDPIVEHEVLAGLARLCDRDTSIKAALDTSRGDWWLAFADDVAVGFAGLRDANTDPEASFLCLAGVMPEHRGRGLQKRLIAARLRRAKALGKRRAITYTAVSNVASANALIARGFRLYRPALTWGDEFCYWKKELA